MTAKVSKRRRRATSRTRSKRKDHFRNFTVTKVPMKVGTEGQQGLNPCRTTINLRSGTRTCIGNEDQWRIECRDGGYNDI
jgi:hypothetical protein